MIGIIQRSKILIVVLSFVLIGLLLLGWFVLSKHNLNKIPSRGVFVMLERGEML